MKIDCHNHSLFSPDSSRTPEEGAEKAREDGIKYLAFTEHMDLGFPNDARPEGEFVFNYMITGEYFERVRRINAAFPDFEVCAGVEVGYTPEDVGEICDKLGALPFGYIVNSVHICHGLDCYWKKFWDGYSREKAYREYIDCVRESLDAPYRYDAVGHLGYIGRPSPFERKTLLYSDFPEELDDILHTVIAKGKILEANSSVGGCAAEGTLCLPDISIFARYYELGGRKVNFGSDSHRSERTGYNYPSVAAALKKIGFTHWTVVRGGKEYKEVID